MITAPPLEMSPPSRTAAHWRLPLRSKAYRTWPAPTITLQGSGGKHASRGEVTGAPRATRHISPPVLLAAAKVPSVEPTTISAADRPDLGITAGVVVTGPIRKLMMMAPVAGSRPCKPSDPPAYKTPP